MENGIVFSIEEFATFDGPGIRSTVFLKGCPLRCMWCHNPEGQEFDAQYVRNPNGCLHCGRCLSSGTGELTQESVGACPRGLVRLCGETYTPRALTERLLKNASLLQAAGGGVTFSGGEPLSQPVFLKRCLDLMEGKLHRALQTSGYCEPTLFREILSRLDYVLFDLKLIDEAAHLHYTGVSNRWILENFTLLAKSRIPFVVRVPLIPGVTDTAENLTSIASLLRENGVSYAELLPYNKMAGGKYAMVGRDYTPTFDENQAPASRPELFAAYGIDIKIL